MDEISLKEKSDTFNKDIKRHIFSSYISIGLAIGSQLQLFEKMIKENKPMSPAQLASLTNCKQRYITEWLRLMTCAGIIDVTEEENFYIPHFKQETLKGSIFDVASIPLMTTAHSKLIRCFQTDGPNGLDFNDVEPYWDYWMKENKPHFFKCVLNTLFKKTDEVGNQLSNGVSVLEIGCGNGSFLHQLGNLYSDSEFIGIDIEPESIATAQATNGAKNSTFKLMDGKKLSEDWTNKFDLVLMVEVLHDLPFPEETLQQVFRVLKQGGTFICVDINIDSDLKEQLKDPFTSTINYVYSLFYCLTLSLNAEGSAGLGTCAGKQKLKTMIEDSCLSFIEMKEIKDLSECVYMIFKKP